MAVSVARYRQTPPESITSQGISVAFARRLKLSGQTNVTNDVIVSGYECNIVVCIYHFSPVTADTIPNAAKYLYYACRSCFSPTLLI